MYLFSYLSRHEYAWRLHDFEKLEKLYMTSANKDYAAFYARVLGRVQGVGFRYSAFREAERYGLRGWVRNTADGEVEVWMEGKPDKLAAFSAWLHTGPRYSRVDSVIKEDVQPRGYKDLRIEY